mmetsp:Transcript_128560/g.411951  ORF Transcript_128560/g.411951 Transcript_128560/m.411951 type:complete len:93 (-) Transcript_128560:9-287(-)
MRGRLLRTARREFVVTDNAAKQGLPVNVYCCFCPTYRFDARSDARRRARNLFGAVGSACRSRLHSSLLCACAVHRDWRFQVYFCICSGNVFL